MRPFQAGPACAVDIDLTLCVFVLLVTILAPPRCVTAQGLRPFVMVGATSADTHDRLKTDVGWIDPRGKGQRRLGFVLGAGATRQLVGRLSARAEVEVVGRGFSDRDSEMRMTYLEAPLLLDMDLLQGYSRSLTASLGGTLGWEVACYAEAIPAMPGAADASSTERREEDCRAFRTERFDWGLAAGLTYGPFRVGGIAATPAVRFVAGERNIAKEYAACCSSRNRTFEMFMTLARRRAPASDG